MVHLIVENGRTFVSDYEYSNLNDLETVVLPESIEKVGKHAFYNCRKLKKISLYGELFQIEDGAFKNCESLSEVEIFAPKKNTACMKNIVADLTHPITFLIHYPNGDARILIPGYNYDYEIDINSRVFHEVVYGSGDAYQRCVGKAELSFGEYDFLFSVAKREETEKTVFELINYRLEYPYKLEEEDKRKYISYLEEHSKEYICYLIENHDQKGLRMASELELMDQENMDFYVEKANETGDIETTAFFMEYGKRYLEDIDQSFEF